MGVSHTSDGLTSIRHRDIKDSNDQLHTLSFYANECGQKLVWAAERKISVRTDLGS